jgi:hypothetical protein
MSKIKLLMFGAVVAVLMALPAAAMAKPRDRNHDRIPDKWEHKFHLSTHRNVANGDPDHDGLNNLGEFRSGTNPRNADTNANGINDANDDQDHDGVSNVDEQQEGTNPRNPDTNHNGVEDGNEVGGTIVSFTEDSANPGTGVLTIKLADNSTISGKVDSSTEIECRTADADDQGDNGAMSRDGGDHGDGGDNGDHHGDNGDHSGPGGDDEQNCTTADLTPGTTVHEAELNGTGDQAVFEKVKLLK